MEGIWKQPASTLLEIQLQSQPCCSLLFTYSQHSFSNINWDLLVLMKNFTHWVSKKVLFTYS